MRHSQTSATCQPGSRRDARLRVSRSRLPLILGTRYSVRDRGSRPNGEHPCPMPKAAPDFDHFVPGCEYDVLFPGQVSRVGPEPIPGRMEQTPNGNLRRGVFAAVRPHIMPTPVRYVCPGRRPGAVQLFHRWTRGHLPPVRIVAIQPCFRSVRDFRHIAPR